MGLSYILQLHSRTANHMSGTDQQFERRQWRPTLARVAVVHSPRRAVEYVILKRARSRRHYDDADPTPRDVVVVGGDNNAFARPAAANRHDNPPDGRTRWAVAPPRRSHASSIHALGGPCSPERGHRRPTCYVQNAAPPTESPSWAGGRC